jgi:hypothetical protein
LQAFFLLGRSLGASASVALSPSRDGILADSVTRLAGGARAGWTWVTPCHARPRFRLINSIGLSADPRALWEAGPLPVGSDFALSARLRDYLLVPTPRRRRGTATRWPRWSARQPPAALRSAVAWVPGARRRLPANPARCSPTSSGRCSVRWNATRPSGEGRGSQPVATFSETEAVT